MKRPLIIFLLISLLIPVACNELDNPIDSQLFSTIPIIGETKEVTAITQNTAVSGGNIVSAKGKNIVSIGVCWDTLQTPTLLKNFTNDGKIVGEFTSNLSDLTANKTYYVRAYLKSGEEVVYGSEVEFKTLEATSPVLTTNAISEITTATAKSGATISSTGGSPITAKGIVWSTSTNPTVNLTTKTNEGNGNTAFLSVLINLQPNTKYYFKAYATNEGGKTGYGNELNFTTKILGPTITDIDGNVYQTITIGTQVWTVENLKTTRYNDGSPIEKVTNEGDWLQKTTGAYCAYGNNESNVGTYGYMYNWYSVNTGNLAPNGWKVPTDDDWNTLANYLGGWEIAGGKMKEAGFTHWVSPNTGATNESGFTGLPGGFRASHQNGWNFDFGGLTSYQPFWSATDGNIRGLGNDYSYLFPYNYPKNYGMAVRLVKSTGSLNNSPAVPSNPTPSHNSMGLAISLTLSWSCSDPDGDALTYDVYFGTDSNPITTISTNQSAQNISHSGLTNFTTYYWKVVAKDNKGGSTSSPVWIFHTVASGSTGIVTDIDGNIYNTITIGTQVWMVENLKTTKYRNGDLISNVEGETAWSNLTTGAYCNYGNDVNNATTYGRLYNWYAVNDSRKIAPTGWHVATDAEWTTLTNFVGGESVAGAKLKSKTGWNSNGNGTDDYGFTAFPGGYRSLGGSFLSLVNIGDWWSSNESSSNGALERTMYYDDNRVISASANKRKGLSVRCIKD